MRAFQAAGDGVAKDTAAIQRAVDACAEAGGGTVLVPPGTYLCGSINLKSHVQLYLERGATLLGSLNKSDYNPYEELGFENDADIETSFFRPALLYGEDLEDIGIAGQGVIDAHFNQRGGPKPIALKRCRFVNIRTFVF